MNKVTITGNLTKDMEMRMNTNNTVIGDFTVANNYGYGEYKKTQFLNCYMYGDNRVSKLEPYMLKGAKVLIDGQLEVNQVEGDDGVTRYFTNIFVDNVEILKFVEKQEEQKTTTRKSNYRNK